MIKKQKNDLKSKKAAIIIAFRDFQDVEYLIPKSILEENGIKVDTISSKPGIAIGAYGFEAEINEVSENLDVNKFDAIVFVGGSGCLKYLDNEISYKIVRDVIDSKKLLASICISPIVLAKAGVLDGKKVTVWTSSIDKNPVKILRAKGATYLNEDVVVDGFIVTASGPSAAEEFGKRIVEMLK